MGPGDQRRGMDSVTSLNAKNAGFGRARKRLLRIIDSRGGRRRVTSQEGGAVCVAGVATESAENYSVDSVDSV